MKALWGISTSPNWRMRFLPASLAVILWSWRRSGSLWSCWQQSPKVYAFGVGSMSLYFSLIYWAFKHAPAFEVNALNYLWPLLLTLFQPLLHRRRPTRAGSAAVLLGFVGTLILFGQAGFTFDAPHLPGYTAAVAAAFVWAGYSIATSHVKFPAAFMGPVLLLSSFVFLGIHSLLEDTVWPDRTLVWMAIAYLSLTRTSVVFWDYAMKKGNIAVLAPLGYLVPLVSSLLMVLFGFQPSSSAMGVAAAFIVAGCLLANHEPLWRLLSARSET